MSWTDFATNISDHWESYVSIASLVLPLLALYLEHKLHIIPRAKKWSAWFLNRRAAVSFSLRFSSVGPFLGAKDSFKTALRSMGPISISRDGDAKLVATSRGMTFTLTDSSPMVQIALRDFSAPIRALRSDVDEILEKLEWFQRTQGAQAAGAGELVDADITVDLPYEWEGVRFAMMRKLSVEAYNVSLKHAKHDCRVSISLRKIHLTTKTRTALTAVLDDLI